MKGNSSYCFLATFLFSIFHLFSISQNLISNDDFEDYPTELIRKNGLLTIYQNQTSWLSFGSIDLFSRKNQTIPCNDFGRICPVSGDAYSGLNCIYPREVAFIKPKATLIKDKLYCITLYQGISINTNELINLNILFSDTLIHDFNKSSFDSFQLPLEDCNFEFGGWRKKHLIYRAVGKENYLCIGNFENEQKVKNEKELKWHHSYFYIDKIVLKEIEETDECNCNTSENNYFELSDGNCKCKPVAFSDSVQRKDELIEVYFNKGESSLTQRSIQKLDSLILTITIKDAEMKNFVLDGYADSDGEKINNIDLSTSRAKTVFEYLSENKISSKRVSYYGHGSIRTLSKNESESEKSKNRKVIIRILSK